MMAACAKRTTWNIFQSCNALKIIDLLDAADVVVYEERYQSIHGSISPAIVAPTENPTLITKLLQRMLTLSITDREHFKVMIVKRFAISILSQNMKQEAKRVKCHPHDKSQGRKCVEVWTEWWGHPSHQKQSCWSNNGSVPKMHKSINKTIYHNPLRHKYLP